MFGAWRNYRLLKPSTAFDLLVCHGVPKPLPRPIRIATTAGPSKDVIDLLKEKVALLTEKIDPLGQRKSVLKTENTNLKKLIENLQQQLASLSPGNKGSTKPRFNFSKILFDRDGETHWNILQDCLVFRR